MFIYSKKYHEYSVCILDALTVDAYQKIAKIADRKVNVRSVVGKSVAAGIILISQYFYAQNLFFTHVLSFLFLFHILENTHLSV
jgi:hypothetical protein